MVFPLPTWSTIIASSSDGTTALFTYMSPVMYFVITAILVIGVLALVAGLLLKLTHHKD